MLKRLLFVSVLTITPLAVAAHSFYDPWCCNMRDCKPYHGRVEETPKGYYLPEFGQVIPYKDAHGISRYAPEAGTRYNVPDGEAQYHICFLPGEPNKIRCFYAKKGGV